MYIAARHCAAEDKGVNELEYLGLDGLELLNTCPGELNAGNFPILKDVSPVSLRLLNASSHKITVSKSVQVPHEGAMPYHLFFLKKGKLAIAKHLDNKLKVIGHLLPGSVYGEFGVLRGRPRNASVITVEASEILCADMSTVRQILDVDKDFKVALERLFRQRLLDNFFLKHPLFRVIPNVVRNTLARELPVQFHERGTQIFKQGNISGNVHLILSGDVDISLHRESGADVLLETRSEPDVLGESFLVSRGIPYTATAASDLDLLLLDRGAIRTIQAKHSAFLTSLDAYIKKRNEKTQARLRAC